jgi:hypothetical protein
MGKGLRSVLEHFLEAPMARIGGAVGGTGALLARDSAAERGREWLDELSRVWLLLLALDAKAGHRCQSRGYNGYLLIKGLGRRGERRVRVWRGEVKRTFVTGRHGATERTGMYVASTIN